MNDAPSTQGSSPPAAGTWLPRERSHLVNAVLVSSLVLMAVFALVRWRPFGDFTWLVPTAVSLVGLALVGVLGAFCAAWLHLKFFDRRFLATGRRPSPTAGAPTLRPPDSAASSVKPSPGAWKSDEPSAAPPASAKSPSRRS